MRAPLPTMLVLVVTVAIDALAIGGCGDTKPPPAPTGPFPTAASCPACTNARYVVSKLTIPTNRDMLRTYACDLDDNGSYDNALASSFILLKNQMIDLQQAANAAANAGSMIVLLQVFAESLKNAAAGRAGAQAFLGAWAGGGAFDAARAYSGQGSFSIAPGSPSDAKLGGVVEDGYGTFGPGAYALQLPLLDGAPPLRLDLVGGRITGDLSAAGVMNGRLCGAVAESQIESRIVPDITSILNERLKLGGETAMFICAVFDTDMNCTPGQLPAACMDFSPSAPPPAGCVSLTEVRTSNIIMSNLEPDVTLGGVRALSLGVGFTAVPAQFTP
jgi:hypothetical protein